MEACAAPPAPSIPPNHPLHPYQTSHLIHHVQCTVPPSYSQFPLSLSLIPLLPSHQLPTLRHFPLSFTSQSTSLKYLSNPPTKQSLKNFNTHIPSFQSSNLPSPCPHNIHHTSHIPHTTNLRKQIHHTNQIYPLPPTKHRSSRYIAQIPQTLPYVRSPNKSSFFIDSAYIS